jgi:hypothetical protein
MRTREVLEGCGASLLLLFPDYLPLFHPQNHDLFHHTLPVMHLTGGLLIDLVWVATLVTGFLAVARSLHTTSRRIAEAMFAGLMLWSIVDVAFLVLFRMWFHVGVLENQWQRSVVVIPLLTGVLAYFAPRVSAIPVRLLRFAVVAFAFSALFIVPHLIRIALLHPALQKTAFSAPAPAASSAVTGRIIWILFDELSYQQTFERPGHGVALPNFQRLRSESVSFSDIRPAGYYTDRIIPSLFLGERFDDFRSDLSGRMLYKKEPQQRWVPYDANATLFALAQKSGWNPAIVGWYNPYCNFLAPVLSACFWTSDAFPLEYYGASEDRSMAANALVLPKQVMEKLMNRANSGDTRHIEDYEKLMAGAKAEIEDTRARFLYIHMPVPHPPGVYDRRTHTFRTDGSYLDNLVLADDALGELMKEIEASSAASATTVIVTSDHSWRIAIYRASPEWTVEEQYSSSRGFDDRPVLLVHFPGQHTGEEISTAVPEMLEHDMLAEMFQGEADSVPDFDQFLTGLHY